MNTDSAIVLDITAKSILTVFFMVLASFEGFC